jgi:hypothetical protein
LLSELQNNGVDSFDISAADVNDAGAGVSRHTRHEHIQKPGKKVENGEAASSRTAQILT